MFLNTSLEIEMKLVVMVTMKITRQFSKPLLINIDFQWSLLLQKCNQYFTSTCIFCIRVLFVSVICFVCFPKMLIRLIFLIKRLNLMVFINSIVEFLGLPPLFFIKFIIIKGQHLPCCFCVVTVFSCITYHHSCFSSRKLLLQPHLIGLILSCLCLLK